MLNAKVSLPESRAGRRRVENGAGVGGWEIRGTKETNQNHCKKKMDSSIERWLDELTDKYFHKRVHYNNG